MARVVEQKSSPRTEAVKNQSIDLGSWDAVEKNLKLIRKALLNTTLPKEQSEILCEAEKVLKESLVQLTVKGFAERVAKENSPKAVLESIRHVDSGKTREIIGELLARRAGELLTKPSEESDPKLNHRNAVEFIIAAVDRVPRYRALQLSGKLFEINQLAILSDKSLSEASQINLLYAGFDKAVSNFRARFPNFSEEEAQAWSKWETKTAYLHSIRIENIASLPSTAVDYALKIIGYKGRLRTFLLPETIRGVDLNNKTANPLLEATIKRNPLLLEDQHELQKRISKLNSKEQTELAGVLKTAVVGYFMNREPKTGFTSANAESMAFICYDIIKLLKKSVDRKDQALADKILGTISETEEILKKYITNTRDGSIFGVLKTIFREIQSSSIEETAAYMGGGLFVGAASGVRTALSLPGPKNPYSVLAFGGTGALAGASNGTFVLAAKNFVAGLPNIIDSALTQRTGHISWTETTFNVVGTTLDVLTGPIALAKIKALHPELALSNIKGTKLNELKDLLTKTLGVQFEDLGEEALKEQIVKVFKKQLQVASKELVDFGGKAVAYTGTTLLISGLATGLHDIFAQPLTAKQRSEAISAFLTQLGKMGLLMAAQAILHAGATKLQGLEMPVRVDSDNNLLKPNPLEIGVFSPEQLPTKIADDLKKVAGLAAPHQSIANSQILADVSGRDPIKPDIYLSHLNHASAADVSIFGLNWIEGIVEGGRFDEIDKLDLKHPDSVSKAISDSVGSKHPGVDLNWKQDSEARSIFLRVIIDRLIKYVDEGHNVEPAIRKIAAVIGNHDPSITSRIEFIDLLITTTQACQRQTTRDTIGEALISQLSYQATFEHDFDRQSIIGKINAQRPELILDILKQLEALGIQAGADFEFDNTGVAAVLSIASLIRGNHPSDLIRYQAAVVVDRINSSFDEYFPDVGARTPHVYSKNLTLLSAAFQKIISTSLAPGEHLLPVSSDYVGVYDRTGTIQRLILFPQEQRPFNLKAEAVDCLKIADTLNKIRSKDEFIYLLGQIEEANSRLLLPETEIALYKQIQATNKLEREAGRLDNKLRDQVSNVLSNFGDRYLSEIENRIADLIRVYPDLAAEMKAPFDSYLKSKNDREAFEVIQQAESLVEATIEFARNNNEVSNSSSFLTLSSIYTTADTLLSWSNKLLQSETSFLSSEVTTWLDDAPVAIVSELREALPSIARTSNDYIKSLDAWAKQQIQIDNLDGNQNLQIRIQAIQQNVNRILAENFRDRVTATPIPLKPVLTSSATIPFGKKDNSDLPLLYQTLHHPTLRGKLEHDYGISLAQLPLRSQLQFLRYIVDQTSDSSQRLKRVLKNHPDSANDIANAFLICAEDNSKAETVLRLAEILTRSDAKRVFSQYARIAVATIDVRIFIEQQLDGTLASENKVREVTTNLLKRANRILQDTLEVVSESKDDSMVKSAVDRLDRVREENILFAAVYRSMPEEVRLKMAGPEHLSISIQPGSELTYGDKLLMKQIGSENSDSTYRNDPRYRDWTKESLSKSLTSGEGEYFVLRVKGKIVAFMRATSTNKIDTKYIGSFNADDFYKDSGLGFYFFKKVIDDLGSKYNLEAVAHKDVPALPRYIGDFGFEITGTIDIGATPDSVYRIRRPQTAKAN